MEELIFKNVHQGDSIILKWNDNNKTKFGVIDCCLDMHRNNPVLNYFKNTKLHEYSIEFICLTHPHTDHYSGLISLFKFFKEQNVLIRNFYHTLSNLTDWAAARLKQDKRRAKKFYTSPVLSNEKNTHNKKNLMYLLMLVRDQQKKNPKIERFIQNVIPVSDSLSVNLNSKWSLNFLSPSYIEYEDYFYFNISVDNSEINFIDSLKINNNPKANILSTIISIESDKSTILLTSDSVNQSLERVKSKIQNKNIILIQPPHHGSKHSFSEEYWRDFKCILQDVKVVISAGSLYGHPDINLVKFFIGNDCEVHCTNNVHGFKEVIRDDKSEIWLNSTLTTDIYDQMNTFGDKVVVFNESDEIIVK